MFDISWSELLILGIVTLVFVGPKELPVFLRTLGRYFGIIQRQAAEFRAHFDEAMREAELDQMKKDVEAMGREVEARVREADKAVRDEAADAVRELDDVAASSTHQIKPPPSSEAVTKAIQPAPAGLEETNEPVPVAPSDDAPSPKNGS